MSKACQPIVQIGIFLGARVGCREFRCPPDHSTLRHGINLTICAGDIPERIARAQECVRAFSDPCTFGFVVIPTFRPCPIHHQPRVMAEFVLANNMRV